MKFDTVFVEKGFEGEAEAPELIGGSSPPVPAEVLKTGEAGAPLANESVRCLVNLEEGVTGLPELSAASFMVPVVIELALLLEGRS